MGCSDISKYTCSPLIPISLSTLTSYYELCIITPQYSLSYSPRTLTLLLVLPGSAGFCFSFFVKHTSQRSTSNSVLDFESPLIFFWFRILILYAYGKVVGTILPSWTYCMIGQHKGIVVQPCQVTKMCPKYNIYHLHIMFESRCYISPCFLKASNINFLLLCMSVYCISFRSSLSQDR